LKQVDVVEMVRIAKDTMEPIAIQRNVSVHFDFEDSLYIKADREEIEIILNNLISNAVKYNKEGGDVFVDLKDLGSKVEIKVKDTGIGMTQEETALLFQEFVRIKNMKTKNITGSGLGLSIVKKLVGLSNGEVTVESKPDVGSTFTITLPK
jgi:signal transduction histidine kinase